MLNRTVALARTTLLAIFLVAGCSTTNVSVGPGANGATPSTAADVCSKISTLPCGPAKDNCTAVIESGLPSCTGATADRQALLDCFAHASYDCSTGIPTTHDCDSEMSKAGCPSEVLGAAQSGDGASGHPTSDGGPTSDAGPNLPPPSNGVCGNLCELGTTTKYECTDSLGNKFTVQITAVDDTCPPITSKRKICHGSFSGNIVDGDYTCDGTYRRAACNSEGSWTLDGDTLNISNYAFVGPCKRL